MTETGSSINKIKSNPILAQPLEVRLWLESKMREDLTNQEILTLLSEKFPWINTIKVQNITSYRRKYVPNYQDLILQRAGKKAQQLPEDIEAEILAEVREAEETGEEFTKDEQRKINMLKAHRTVLSELWKNYRAVKTTSDETAKRGYLVEMAKELSLIGQLEASEKSFLSSMDEVRKAELKMSVDQYLDSICGWFVPRAMDKAGSKEKAQEAINILKAYLDDYSKVLEGSNDIAEANRVTLERLYVSQKIKKEEIENV